MQRNPGSANVGGRARWAGRALCGILAVATIPLAAAAAADGAVALQASAEVERALLQQDVQEHERLVARRAQVAVRLQNLYATLDFALRKEEVSVEEIETVLAQVEEAEREHAQVVEAQRDRVRTVVERARRIREYEARAGILRAEQEERSGALAGTWEVALQPTGQRGVFRLEQSGVLVSGTYTLEGGWSGSLQGTLVNRKVYLVRIDSRLGRSMEFQGFVASDGATIRGTWLNYDLGAEGGAEGQWSATRSAD